MNTGKFNNMDDLHAGLRDTFSVFEKVFGRNTEELSFSERFSGAIKRAYEQTGQKAVILIDEYDAPLQAALDKPELLAQFQSELRSIYLCLKNNDEYIRFAFLTGITAWGTMGVFSSLNNLKDISLDNAYATLCGITEKELHHVFHEEVGLLANENNLCVEEAYQQLKTQYDGYHFAMKSPGIYNPFSILNALSQKELRNYWIQTGATQFIATMVQHVNIDVNELLCGNITMAQESLLNPFSPYDSPFTFLYQAGYLTLNGIDPATKQYRLQVPNGEVRGSLAAHLQWNVECKM